MCRLFVVPVLLALAACSSHIVPPGPGLAHAQALPALAAKMKADYPGLEGKYFELTSNNLLPANWIFATPEGMWGRPQVQLLYSAPGLFKECAVDQECAGNGQPGSCAVSPATVSGDSVTPRKICLSHTQRFLEEYYSAILNARNSVDIVYLGPPEGRFEQVLINALSYVAHLKRALVVRILSGGPETGGPAPWNTKQFLEKVKARIPNFNESKLIVQAAQLGTWCCVNPVVLSWTHSKVLLVDGETAMVGGHNMVDAAYLATEPTFDLSIKAAGGIAQSATKYTNELFSIVNARRGQKGIYCHMLWENSPELRDYCNFVARNEPRPITGTVPILAVAVPGKPFTNSDRNPSRDAFSWLIARAKSSIKLSQQDVLWGGGPVVPAPPSLPALMLRALEGVDIYWVLSNPGAPHGMTSNISMRTTALSMLNSVRQYTRRFGGITRIRALLCRKVHLTGIGLNERENEWQRTKEAFGNHAKSYIIDDAIFYVGSDNIYRADVLGVLRADLQEYGFIIEDKASAAEFAKGYFDKMWDASKRRAVSGSHIPPERCIFNNIP
jgi:phosphatidylserine/phosphatidylglycerophosphate/cardiolipin synthase-like enzyme